VGLVTIPIILEMLLVTRFELLHTCLLPETLNIRI